jgi:hypothetical protein
MNPFYWDFRGQGVMDVEIPFAPVNPHSIVLASATEVQVLEGGGFSLPFIGVASVQIINVAPQNGLVRIRVHIMWEEPLFVRISGIVVQP